MGPQYGVQQSPDLVGSRTPVANQIVDGINSFVDGFKTSKESEKQAARQRFLDGIQMLQMGLPVDQKKMARDARTAGLNFDYEGPTAAERQAQQQQSAPMPGMPMPSGDMMQLPPGMMMPAGQPTGGAPLPMQVGGPPTGAPMGGRGFFGRLGQAMTQPFQAPPPIPEGAGVYQALDQLQQRGQGAANLQDITQQVEMLKQQTLLAALPEIINGKAGTESWIKSAKAFFAAGGADILSAYDDEINAQAIGKTPEQYRKLKLQVELANNEARFTAPLINAGVPPENAHKAWQQTIETDGMIDSDLLSIAASPQEYQKSYNYAKEQWPKITSLEHNQWAIAESTGDFDTMGTLRERFGPTVAEQREGRATEDQELQREANAIAKQANVRATESSQRAAEDQERTMQRDELKTIASRLLNGANGDVEKAVQMLQEQTGRSTKIADHRTEIEAEIRRSKAQPSMDPMAMIQFLQSMSGNRKTPLPDARKPR